MMFRGIIFRGALAQPQFNIWPAIWLTAVLIIISPLLLLALSLTPALVQAPEGEEYIV